MYKNNLNKRMSKIDNWLNYKRHLLYSLIYSLSNGSAFCDCQGSKNKKLDCAYVCYLDNSKMVKFKEIKFKTKIRHWSEISHQSIDWIWTLKVLLYLKCFFKKIFYLNFCICTNYKSLLSIDIFLWEKLYSFVWKHIENQ